MATLPLPELFVFYALFMTSFTLPCAVTARNAAGSTDSAALSRISAHSLLPCIAEPAPTVGVAFAL